MDGIPPSGPALSATHSHLSFCLRSTSSLLSGNSAVSAAQAAMGDGNNSEGDGSAGDVLQRSDEDNQIAGPAMETGLGKLKDEVRDQEFEDGDAAQLFIASSLRTNTTNGETLADDAKRKEEIKTASANPATHLTSEEESIEGIDVGRRGLLHCGSSDLDTSVHTESEGGILLEKCDKEALDLVEGALLRMLSGKSAVPLRENLPVKASGDWKTSEVEEREQIRRLRNSEGSVSSGAEEDMQLLAKLLEEVHTLRAKKKQGIQVAEEPRSEKDYGIWATAPRRTASTVKRAGSKEKKVVTKNDEMRLTLEAASQAAKAAADAAQAAAASVAKNSEAIEMLLRTLSPSLSTFTAEQLENRAHSGGRRRRRRRKPKVEESESSEAAEEKSTKKKIVKQNRTTHWILGFMVVTTLVWRFGIVKVASRLKHKLSNPLDYVGGLLGGATEPGSDTEAAEGTSQNNLLSQIKLPSILQGDAEKESDTPTALEDPEVKKKEEEKVFNFGNILQIKPNSK